MFITFMILNYCLLLLFGRYSGRVGYVPSMYLQPYNNPYVGLQRTLHSSTFNVYLNWRELWRAFLHRFPEFQVAQCCVKGYADGIFRGPVCSVCKLMWVKCGGKGGSDVLRDQFLKALHDYWCKCNRSVVIHAVGGWFPKNGDDGSWF